MKSIKELDSLSDKGIYQREKIEWWLMKYRKDYQQFDNDVFPSMKITFRADSSKQHKEKITLINETRAFVNTYKILDKVSEFYRNEIYYKEELEIYSKLKNNLNAWIRKSAEDSKYSEFVNLFQDNRTPLGYKLDILYPLDLPLKISLYEPDFNYTFKYLEILKNFEK
jgi:hypothetical protein